MDDTNNSIPELTALYQHVDQRFMEIEEKFDGLIQMMERLGQERSKEGPRGAESSNRIVPSRGEEGEEGRSGSHIVPRYSKMEFPTYDGSEDPLVWLHRCEQFFLAQRMPEEEKVRLAAFDLIGQAQLRYFQFSQEEPILHWGMFKKHCNLRFGPHLNHNPVGELANLKQTGSVEEYQNQFQILLARTVGLPKDLQVNLFTAGLVDGLRIEVEMQNPINLGAAMNLARAYEKKMQFTQGVGSKKTTASWNSWRQSSSFSAPAASQGSKGSSGSKGSTTSSNSLGTPPIRRLT